jgi:hypothetical protein
MKYTLASIFIFSMAVCVYPIPLETIITSDKIVQVFMSDNKQLVAAQLKNNPVPSLMPDHDNIRQSVMETINKLNPNILVETLYLYKKPAKSETEPAVWDEKQKITVFNQLTAISTLTGIKYYSSSRKAMRIFYEYSSIIDDPVTKKPLSDPVFTQIPASLTVFARQKDLTFGDNIYRYGFLSKSDVILFTQENITPLNYGVIPIIGKNNLRSVMAVVDGGDWILVYAASMAKAASVPGFADKISASFSNRAQAVLKWFSEKLNNKL